ncbi:MAG: hypothetical protein KAS32_25160 [Candidatus Peribacteraceae bacterium]|nr:hypothetical protein [Candidatus Peribacteraceae bacterium]
MASIKKINGKPVVGGGSTPSNLDHATVHTVASLALAAAAHTVLQVGNGAVAVDLNTRQLQSIELIDFFPANLQAAWLAGTPITDDIMPYFLAAYRSLCTYDNGGGDSASGIGGTIDFPKTGQREYIIDSTCEPVLFANAENAIIKDIIVNGNGCHLKLSNTPTVESTSIFNIFAEEVGDLTFNDLTLDGNGAVLGSLIAAEPFASGILGATDGIQFWFNVANPDGLIFENVVNYDAHASLVFASALDYGIVGAAYRVKNVLFENCRFGPWSVSKRGLAHKSYSGGSNTVDDLVVALDGQSPLWLAPQYKVEIINSGVNFKITRVIAETFERIEYNGVNYVPNEVIVASGTIASWTASPFIFNAANLDSSIAENTYMADANNAGTTLHSNEALNSLPSIQFDAGVTYTDGESWLFRWADLRKVNGISIWGNTVGGVITREHALANNNIKVLNCIAVDGGEITAIQICSDVVIDNCHATDPSYSGWLARDCVNSDINNCTSTYSDEHVLEVRGENLSITNCTFLNADTSLALKSLGAIDSDIPFNNFKFIGNTVMAGNGSVRNSSTAVRSPLYYLELETQPSYTVPKNWIIANNTFLDSEINPGQVKYAFSSGRGAATKIDGFIWANNTYSSTFIAELDDNLKSQCDLFISKDTIGLNKSTISLHNYPGTTYGGLFWGDPADVRGMNHGGPGTPFNFSDPILAVSETTNNDAGVGKGMYSSFSYVGEADSARKYYGMQTAAYWDSSFENTATAGGLSGYNGLAVVRKGGKVGSISGVSFDVWAGDTDGGGTNGEITDVTVIESNASVKTAGSKINNLTHFGTKGAINPGGGVLGPQTGLKLPTFPHASSKALTLGDNPSTLEGDLTLGKDLAVAGDYLSANGDIALTNGVFSGSGSGLTDITATTVAVVESGTSVARNIPFLAGTGSSAVHYDAPGTFTYKPSTNTLTVTNIIASTVTGKTIADLVTAASDFGAANRLVVAGGNDKTLSGAGGTTLTESIEDPFGGNNVTTVLTNTSATGTGGYAFSFKDTGGNTLVTINTNSWGSWMNTTGGAVFGAQLKIAETAAAAVDTAAHGQIWVRSSDSTLMFTSDDGTDYKVDVTAV